MTASDLPVFEPLTVAGKTVLVSRGALAFSPAELTQALGDHGPAGGSRESKHRFRRGTLFIVSRAATGEILIATTTEMRALRKGLSTFNPTRVAPSPGRAGGAGLTPLTRKGTGIDR